jgi:propanol-preferring alcohol dehydrogenase
MRLVSPKPAEAGPLALHRLEPPEPGPGQVRLRVRFCGVCHTDVHTVEGDLALSRLPITPGHQIVGVGDALGEGASRQLLGQRLGVGWLNETCGRCDYCLGGLENLCPEARFTGLHADGGYAEYVLANERFAFALPEAFADDIAAPLLCAGIVGYRAMRLSGVRPGERLGLFGFGASAHLVLQVARHQECEIFVFTRGRRHRELALSLGAAWAGGADDDCPEQLDAAILFAPAGPLVPSALKRLRPGGGLAINAIAMSDLPSMPYDLLYRERAIRSVANYTRGDALEFLALAGQIPLRPVVETFDLADANRALALLKRSELDAAAVLKVTSG